MRPGTSDSSLKVLFFIGLWVLAGTLSTSALLYLVARLGTSDGFSDDVEPLWSMPFLALMLILSVVAGHVHCTDRVGAPILIFSLMVAGASIIWRLNVMYLFH